MQSKEYYKQAEIWGKGVEEYQRQVLATLFEIIPPDVKTILDIGAGDGYITNPLAQKYDVTGMDISEEALSYLECKVVVGNIADIPFPKDRFDLVMANDVIEHLPDDIYEKSLQEMQRVSKKYIIITVPHNEDLLSNTIVCQNCKQRYHKNHHQRNYTAKKMDQLPSFESWQSPIKFLTGDITLPIADPTARLRQIVSATPVENAICPHCHTPYAPQTDEIATALLDDVRQRSWISLNERNSHNRSEIMSLFVKPTHNSPVIDYPVQENAIYKDSLNRLDFSNIIQIQLAKDSTVGNRWVQFQGKMNLKQNTQGISCENPDERLYFTAFFFASKVTGKLELEIDGFLETDWLEVYLIDGVTGFPYETKLQTAGNAHITFTVPAYTSSKFGYQVDVYYQGSGTIRSMWLEGSDPYVDFAAIHPGQNIFQLNKTLFSTYFSSTSGSYPLLTAQYSAEHVSIQKLYQEITNTVQNYNIFQSVAEEEKNNAQILAKENLKLDSKTSSLIKENLQLKEEAENVLLRIKSLQSQYNKQKEFLSKQVDIVKHVSERKTQKVLVLSFMFPYELDENNGIFVYEQVKSLRENQLIDARVISCKPYWFNSKNPLKLVRQNRDFWQDLRQRVWVDSKGVPTLYLPYRVGHPYIPFTLHSKSYVSSVMAKIEEVRKEFNFDLVHAHTSYLDGNAARAIFKKYKTPYVITEHTGPFETITSNPFVKRQTYQAIRDAQQVWGVSDAQQQTIRDHFMDEPAVKDKIQVMYNGVDMTRFSIQPKKEKKKITFMFIGYLVPIKNVDILLQSFEALHSLYPDTELILIGEGECEAELKKKVTQLRSQGDIKFLGAKPHKEIPDLLNQQCDILVLPSEKETFGVVLIEAMASGIPCVSTYNGGAESIIVNDRLGQLCEPGNVEALTQAMQMVMKNLHTYNPAEIAQYAADKFSQQTIAEQLEKAYQEAR